MKSKKNDPYNGLKFIHIRSANSDLFGGITIAYAKPRWDAAIDNLGGVDYHYSICSKKDHYNKRLGREISMGRFNFEPQFTYINKPNHQFNLVGRIIEGLRDNPFFATRLTEDGLWLD